MKQRNLQQDLQLLGLTEQSLQQTLDRIADGPGCWDKRTGAFRELVRSARKEQLRKWHPDVCQDTRAEEQSQEINAAADALLTLKILPPQQRQVRVVIMSPWWPMEVAGTGTGTSTIWPPTGTGGWW